MTVQAMFTKEFAEAFGDVDVYDDVCEELGVGFCAPVLLTEDGRRRFGLVLNDKVEIDEYNAVVKIDHLPDGVWQKHLRVLKELFNGCAGYCTDEEWNKWFFFPEGHFVDDDEKMHDFLRLTREEFLASYSYLTEAEYDATVLEVERLLKARTEAK